MPHYSAIVLGLGAVGSAALLALARRGVRALGLDRFPPGHDRGSSHGQTRIIRQAYFEHPDYVPLVLRAYELWSDLEKQCGQTLFQATGLLQVGPPEGAVLGGVRASAARHQLPVEELTGPQIQRRWPGFRVPPPLAGVFEARAGLLHVERCVRAMATAATQHGAEIRTGSAVLGWWPRGHEISVQTEQRHYLAERLIIAAGAWAPRLLSELEIPFHVRKKPQYWFEPASTKYDLSGGCPAFLFELPAGVFYGFPRVDERGVKVARHTGGEPVADPLFLDRAEDPADRVLVEQFLRECLPDMRRKLLHHAACMYTMSPDEHFIVDRHPHCPNVAFAAGLSGHGFKFAPVLGEALADLVLEGATPLPVSFLGLERLKGVVT